MTDDDRVYRIEDIVKRVQVDRRVMVTYMNYPYLDQFYVSYMTSRLWRYRNFMVVALDQETYDILHYQGFPVALIKTEVIPQYKRTTVSNYGDHNFNVLVKLKLVLFHKILSMGVSCLFFDSDIILFKDPFSGFPQPEDYDFVAQRDEHICTGFMYFRPTKNSFDLLKRSLQTMEGREMNDQDAIQEIVIQNRIRDLKWHYLDDNAYSKGSIFFTAHQFPWTPVSPSQIMAHNNYVISHVNKMYRLKEAGLYAFDVNHEYSDPDATYLTLEEYTDRFQDQTMEMLVRLANALNRHLVVPQLSCVEGLGLVPPCNLCGHQHLYCMNSILQNANLPWKEHVGVEQQDHL